MPFLTALGWRRFWRRRAAAHGATRRARPWRAGGRRWRLRGAVRAQRKAAAERRNAQPRGNGAVALGGAPINATIIKLPTLPDVGDEQSDGGSSQVSERQANNVENQRGCDFDRRTRTIHHFFPCRRRRQPICSAACVVHLLLAAPLCENQIVRRPNRSSSGGGTFCKLHRIRFGTSRCAEGRA